MQLIDIITNMVSDLTFVFLIWLLLEFVMLILQYSRLEPARRFFGLRRQFKVRIYLPGFVHPKIKTKKVVTALEYETAVELREGLNRVPGPGFLRRVARSLAGVIGQEFSLPEAEIEITTLDDVTAAVPDESAILIGGPITNQLTKFYMSGTPRFRYNKASGKYEQCDNNHYQSIEPSDNMAVVEKLIVDGKVVILVHGFGEEQTRRAVRYLAEHWHGLYKQYREQEFGILV